MTKRLVWLEKSQRDLIHIKTYYTEIAGKSGSIKILQRIISSANLLQQYQHIGQVLEDEELSEWHIPKTFYTLTYRFINNELQILRIFHKTQNKPSQRDET